MIDLENNTIQIFNEVSLLVICTMMFNFTEHIPNAEERYKIGWIFLYLIYFNVGVNLFIVVALIIKKIKIQSQQKLFIKRQRAKLRMEAEHNRAIDVLGKGKSKKELKKFYIKNSRNSLSVSSNEVSIDLDKIGRQKKVKEIKERTFLQKRKDAKENFLSRMAEMQEEDNEIKSLELKYDFELKPIPRLITKFEDRKEELDKKTLPTQNVDDWEIAMWDDIAQDQSGNVVRLNKQNKDNWELMSSPSVRERRKLQ